MSTYTKSISEQTSATKRAVSRLVAEKKKQKPPSATRKKTIRSTKNVRNILKALRN